MSDWSDPSSTPVEKGLVPNERPGWSLTGALGGITKGVTTSTGSISNLVSNRLSQAGLASFLGGKSTSRSVLSNTQWLNAASGNPIGKDWRLRVSLGPNAGIFYDAPDSDIEGNILKPLKNTSGVIFPITPQLNITHNAKYNSSSPTHSNYALHFYESSEIAEIQIYGDFPVQNNDEGLYLLAAIYFFRASTKMFWGSSLKAGTPPPLLFLHGYGKHYFPDTGSGNSRGVPCVLKSFLHTMPQDVDYIEVITPGSPGPGGMTRLPTLSQIQITLQPLYSRKSLKDFTTEDFASGRLVDKGFM